MLNGHVLLVTGADGGIGRAVMTEALDRGARVVMIDHPGSEVMDTAARHGDDVVGVAVDLTCSDAPEVVLEATARSFGPATVLVNNAGIKRSASLVNTSDEDFDAVLDVNLRAAFRLSRAVVDDWRGRDRDERRAIVNVVSVNGLHSFSGAHGYAASKAGLVGLTRSMARELGPHGIRVNAVAPGMIRTPMTHGPDGLPADWMDQALEGVPLRRVGEPHDIARVIAFLASSLAGYVTGQVVVADGGGLPES